MMTDIQSGKNWDFDGGRLPLDFANTAEWHLSQEPDEWLTDYPDLVDWSAAAGLIGEDEAFNLLAEAARHPQEAEAVLDRAIALREAAFKIFMAVTKGEETRNSELGLISNILQESSEYQRIEHTARGFEWVWSCVTLDCMLGPIARSIAELLTSSELDRVGLCADEDRGCGYLFYDTSRNHSRRWCSMESCGNRAKAKRHYRRQTDSVIAQGERA